MNGVTPLDFLFGRTENIEVSSTSYIFLVTFRPLIFRGGLVLSVANIRDCDLEDLATENTENTEDECPDDLYRGNTL